MRRQEQCCHFAPHASETLLRSPYSRRGAVAPLEAHACSVTLILSGRRRDRLLAMANEPISWPTDDNAMRRAALAFDLKRLERRFLDVPFPLYRARRG